MMTVNTNAARTVVGRAMAEELELEPLDKPIPDNVPLELEVTYVAQIQRVTLGDKETGPIEVLVCETCDEADGILGRDLMERYGLTVDPSAPAVYLRECAATPSA